MAETDTAAVEMDTAPEDVFSSGPQELINFLRPDLSEEDGPVEDEPVAEEPTEETPKAEGTPGSETETPDKAPETEQPSPFAGKTDDEIAAIPEIKSLLARRTEGARRQSEAETAAKLHAQNQQHVASGAVLDELTKLVTEAEMDERGQPKIDREKVASQVASVLNTGVDVGVNALAAVLNEQTGEGFKLTDAESESVKGALARYYQNPADPTPVMRAWLAPYARHVIAAQTDEMRAQIEREVRAELKAAEQADRAKGASASRRGPNATPVNGTPVRSNRSEWDEANAALSETNTALDWLSKNRITV